MEFPSDARFKSISINSDDNETLHFKRPNPNSHIDGQKYKVDPILVKDEYGVWGVNSIFIPKDLFKFKVTGTEGNFIVTMDSGDIINGAVYSNNTFHFLVNGVYQFTFEDIVANESTLSILGDIYTDVDGRSEVAFGENVNGALMVTIAPLVRKEGEVRTMALSTWNVNIYSEVPENYF